jgi:hypothetical protein
MWCAQTMKPTNADGDHRVGHAEITEDGFLREGGDDLEMMPKAGRIMM